MVGEYAEQLKYYCPIVNFFFGNNQPEFWSNGVLE